MIEFIKSIILYKDYLIQSVLRDLRKRYKRSLLGYFWSMLNPLLMMLVLTVVFSAMMRNMVEHYAVFLFAGMIPWAYFSSTSLSSLHSITGNIRIISQIPVPKYLFVLSLAFSNMYTFVISLVPLAIIALILGHPITWHYLLFPVFFIPLFLITVGLSLCLSALNVFFEDTEHLTGVVIQAMYFMCPILYPVTMLSENVSAILKFNPLFTMIEIFKDIFYYGQIPSLLLIGYATFTSVVVLMIGLFIFNKADKKMIYFV